MRKKARGKEMWGRYFSNTANIFVAVLFRKSEVFVQSKAHVVSVEPVGGQADMEQVLLEGGCNRRLARS